MVCNPIRKALACTAAFALIVAAGTANAQVTKEDAGCRATIQKTGSKLGSTALKAIDGCIKAALKAGTSAAGCNTIATADTKGKVPGAQTKLTDGVASKCTGVATATALAEYQPACPSPGNDAAVGSFAEVGTCQIDINTDGIEMLRRYVLSPDAPAIFADPLGKDISKCANAIAKNVTKAWGGAAKLRGKAQAGTDKALGAYNYSGHTTSTASVESDCSAAIAGSCAGRTGVELGLIHSCDNTPAGIGACACHAAVRNSNGSTATAFDFDGVCPIEVKVAINSGTGTGGRLTRTELDTGWTGLGHKVDVVDGFVGRVNLACSDTTCGTCSVTTNCEAGNCRCSNNPATTCSVPFVAGGPCGAGTCNVLFGPPLALSAGGSPVCVTNTIATELVGTADAGTGESNTTVNNVAKVFLGITQNQPCPTCSGATIGAAGTCSGGANAGAACTTNAIHPDFGNVSYQCQPTLGGNISGSGLQISLSLTDGAVSLGFDDPCDSPLGALDCACGACSGDNTVPCKTDAECAALVLGTCGKGTSGAVRKPNSCADLTCEDQGNERGQCNGETDSFCSGFVRKTGDGILTCTTNADCTALNSECPASNCGTCILLQPKRCYLDPIDVDGTAGIDGAELVSTFCSPPTNNLGINGAGGIPGAGRIKLDFDFTGYCPNGTTEFELGGANCP